MIAAWERFWFEPESTASLAVFRIVFGVLALGWTLSLSGDLDAFFSTNGLLNKGPGAPGPGAFSPCSPAIWRCSWCSRCCWSHVSR